MYNYVRYRMEDAASAEDVVAEAYLKVARSFGAFDPSCTKFSTWVIAIARRCVVDHHRRVRPLSALEDVPERAYAIPGEQDAVDDRMLVEQLLRCVDDTERDLVALKYRDGLRNVEIAELLDMNPSTVSTKLANAIGKMRRILS